MKYAKNPSNPDDELVNDIIKQEKLPDAFMLDMSIRKSILFTYNFRLYMTLMVSNLLDNTNYITGGYEDNTGYSGEKYRYRSSYYYALGRTYYFMVSLIF